MGSYDNELDVQLLLELLEVIVEGVHLAQRATDVSKNEVLDGAVMERHTKPHLTESQMMAPLPTALTQTQT